MRRLKTNSRFVLVSALVAIATAGAAQRAVAGPKPGKLDCAVLRPIAQGFLSHHIDAKKLEGELEGRTIERFIKHLDAQKFHLLESDVAEIRGILRGSFKSLGEDCGRIEKAHQVYVKRVKEAYEFVGKTLDAGYKFSENTELVFDANLRTYPKTRGEAQALLLKYVHFQISNYLASDMKLPKAKKQLTHRYELAWKRQVEIKRDDLYSMYLDSFASALDAHSSYLSPDAQEDFEIQMSLSLQGIGAALTWDDGYTTVESLIPGGAAERSGELQPKDKIIAVAQANGSFEPVIDMPLRDVVKLIRGKKGTNVRLTVLRQGPKETSRLVIALKRDTIKLEDEVARLVYSRRKVEGGRELKIAIIDLRSFYGDLKSKTRSCFDDVKKLVERAAAEKADGVILDVSANGGGLLTEAVRIGGLFIRKGNIVATQNAREKLDFLHDDDEAVQYNGPLVVLTSRLSASASEIVAGALQDYRRAIVVGGDHTFGKGTVQAMINLPSGLGAIKVTTGMFYVPGGKSTQFRGVPADIVLPSAYSVKDIGENTLDYSLQPKSVAEFVSKEASGPGPSERWAALTPELVGKLKSLSATRVEKDPEFKKIRDEMAEQEKKKGVIRLADSLKKQKEEKAKDSKKPAKGRGRRQSEEDYLKVAQVNEAVLIMADLIQGLAPAQQASVAR